MNIAKLVLSVTPPVHLYYQPQPVLAQNIGYFIHLYKIYRHIAIKQKINLHNSHSTYNTTICNVGHSLNYLNLNIYKEKI